MDQEFQSKNKLNQNEHNKNTLVDAGPQTFFYTLTNMLNLSQAKNILQVGCGAGKLLSTIVDLKNPSALYIASDLSQQMIKISRQRLRSHFDKYESNLSFEEWLIKMNINFQIQDGENIDLKGKTKFDRIIANMVLCHASDPEKMLKSWHSVASQNCYLGISLLGDPNKNQFVRAMKESAIEVDQKLPEKRQPYYWYDKISKIAQESGWQIVLQWQQNGIFPFLQYNQALKNDQFKKMIQNTVPQKVRESFNNKMSKVMNQDKKGIQFSAKLIIAKKCTK